MLLAWEFVCLAWVGAAALVALFLAWRCESPG